jgi:hypothetical protein
MAGAGHHPLADQDDGRALHSIGSAPRAPRVGASPTSRRMTTPGVPGRSPNGGDASLAGWRSRLAAVTVAYLLFQGLTGLWAYLGPFSVHTQLQVLAHAFVGLVLAVPYLVYQLRHFLVWWRQRPTAEMILGYALAAAASTATASGSVLVVQAARGPRLDAAWDRVHLISGIATVALLAAHVLLVFARRRPAARRRPELALAQRRFARWSLGGAAGLLSVLGVVGLGWPRRAVTFPVPASYSLPEYAQAFDEYRGSPFAPSYARTEGLALLDPAVLAGSGSCGSAGCHQEILAEWQPSAHRFAAMNPPFLAVQRAFAADRGAAETRYCGGCHDPISLFAGAKDLSYGSEEADLSAPGVEEGISCAACHAISQVDVRGNADYVLTPPRRYLGEGAGGASKWLSDFLIRAYPRQHLADYDRNVLRTPEACGACHKQFIPEALNRFGLTEGQNQYDEWRRSPWHRSAAEGEDLACRDCHMRLVPGSRDPGRGESGDRRRRGDDGAHRHHGFIGANLFMPELLDLPGWQRHVALTEEWVRGETVLPEIADLWPGGPVASVQLVAPELVAAGDELAVRVLVTNRKAGHNFSTGPMDFIRAWIHLTARDSAGRVVAEWGAIDPATRRISDRPGELHEIGNPRDQGTLVLEAMPLDEKGELLRRHELWKKAGGKGKRVIFPGYTDSQVYRLTIPPETAGPLTLVAELAYRRYRQEFLDLMLPGLEEAAGVYQPTVVQASARRTVEVAAARTSREGG